LAVKCSSRTDRAMLASSGERIPPWGVPVIVSRYDLKLWVGHLLEGAAYLPR
jgi:hypothetical protein